MNAPSPLPTLALVAALALPLGGSNTHTPLRRASVLLRQGRVAPAPVLLELGWLDEAVAHCKTAWSLDETTTGPAVSMDQMELVTGGCAAAAPYVEALGARAAQEPDLAGVLVACGGG